MTPPELAAALVAAWADRLERTGPLEDPVAPCLAAVLQVLVDHVAPADMPECNNCCLSMVENIRQEILETNDALEAMND